MSVIGFYKKQRAGASGNRYAVDLQQLTAHLNSLKGIKEGFVPVKFGGGGGEEGGKKKIQRRENDQDK